MTIIKIAYDVSEEALERVKDVLEYAAAFIPAWNGARFKIERDNYTCIEDAYDEYAATGLMQQINNAIGGYEPEDYQSLRGE